MSTPWDAIVVGAGHNGLVAAAYLAKAGLKVLVLEARETAGGLAETREFAPGFRVSGAAHLLHALHPRVLKDLALARHGFAAGTGPLPTVSPLGDGRFLEISADAEATRRSLTQVSAQDAAAYHPAMARLTRLAEALGFFLLRAPPSLAFSGNGWREKLALARFAVDLRLLGRKDMLELTRILTMNVADLAGDLFASDAVKGMLAFEATLGLFLGARSPNTVFNLLYRLAGLGRHGLGGHYLPPGGMGALAAALERAARAHGAIIRTAARVERILIERDRAVGIVLAGGEEIRAAMVAAGVDPQSLLLKLVEPGALDAGFVKRIRHLRMNGCVGKLHLALDGLPASLPPRAARLVLAPSPDHVERAFDCAKYGAVSALPALEMVIPSLADPSLAPPGQHVASILYQYAPYRLRETAPEAARAAMLKHGLAALESAAPGIAARVIAAEALSPFDLEARFGLSGGQWHHGEITLDQMFFLRPAPLHQRYRMPIPGLFLCGAGAHPGGNLSGAPGANAARAMLRAHREGRAAA